MRDPSERRGARRSSAASRRAPPRSIPAETSRRALLRAGLADVAAATALIYKGVMPASLAPGLLLASPPLGDPNFDRTVVLLALHGAEGALGFVVNRPVAVTVGELLRDAGYDADARRDLSSVWSGGPVAPQSGWILVDAPELEGGEGAVIPVGARVRVTSSRSMLEAIARGTAPARRMVLLGYSGWGPGQLETEIAAGAWIPVALDERVLFEVEAARRWEAAYAGAGLSPAAMMTARHTGSA